jgi:ParB family transcriptional regulator, chromosome partitioning protein
MTARHDMDMAVALPPGMPATNGNGGSYGAFPVLASNGRLRTVSLDAIHPNPHQPRGPITSESLAGLVASIKARGILQPPVVRKVADGYELIAGERRCRAARLAGLTAIEVLVGDHDDEGSLLDALVENVERQDLSPIETARAYATCTQDLRISQGQLAERIGVSRGSINNHVRLLDLPDDVIDLLAQGQLSFAHGRELAGCKDCETQKTLAARAVAGDWTSRRLAEAVKLYVAPVDKRAQRQAHRQAATEATALSARLTDRFSQATGLDVRVAVKGRKRTITVDDTALRAIADRLGVSTDAFEV